eukprot:TRINITY_DN22472_c0_g1_i1.p1 TRINITY_DN22472_c0_g1~~TRINITY_DN22472_c0_g1_i1.p1  ORF type:complete len:703 (+),score=200.18 TRINITY_DN22472_c0_g1_i1:162-2270(+)
MASASSSDKKKKEEDMQFGAGKKDKERWQWRGKLWACFSDQDSSKMQHAFVLGKPSMTVWDGGCLREIDFTNMRQLPGRQPLRFAPPIEASQPSTKKPSTPPPAEASPSNRGSPSSASQSSPSKSTQPVTPKYEAKAKTALSEDLQGDLEGLRILTHAAFIYLQKPRFNMRGSTPEEEYQMFLMRRRLDLCEEPMEMTYCLAEIYRELLDTGRTELPLLLKETSKTMAALAIAFHLAGAHQCGPDPKYWYLSGRIHNEKTKHKGSAAGESDFFPTPAATSGAMLLPKSASAPALKNAGLVAEAPRTSMSGMAGSAQLLPTLPPAMLKAMLEGESTPLNSWTLMHMRSGGRGKLLPKAKPPGAIEALTFRLESSAHARTQSLWLVDAWKQWAKAASIMEQRALEPLPQQDGSWKYLALSSEPEHCLVRMSAAVESLLKMENEGRCRGNLDKLGDKVTIYSYNLRGGGSMKIPQNFKIDLKVEPGLSSVDLALQQAAKGRRCVGTLICSRDRVGGGFMSGIRPGLEEEICMRSNLYLYLRQALFKVERDHITNKNGCCMHVPEDGCVLCRDVDFFRGGKDSGFAAMEEPQALPGVICFSLKNLNEYQSMDAAQRVELSRHNRGEYQADLRKKFEMVLNAAHDMDAEILTVSDQGCEDLHNNGRILGVAFGHALTKIKFKPPRILLSGTSEFIASVKKTVMSNRT